MSMPLCSGAIPSFFILSSFSPRRLGTLKNPLPRVKTEVYMGSPIEVRKAGMVSVETEVFLMASVIFMVF